MTTDSHDPAVESLLARALSFEIPADSRRTIDVRVDAAVSAEPRYRPGTARRPRLFSLTPRMFAGLAAAMILFAATAVGAGTLFSRLTDGAPLLENVWDRATDVGQSVTDAGYTVTLEKAAVDVDRIWVAVAISSDRAGADDVWDMQVVDANGVAYTGGTGAGTGEVRGASALLFGFKVPDGVTPAGPFALEIDALDVQGVKTPGTWHFTFDAPLTPAWSQAPTQMTAPPAGS
jgi:hypothetical protein